MIRKPALRALLFFLFGILAALPVSFTQVSVLAFVSLIPALFLLFSDLLLCELPCRARTYYGYGLCFSVGYFMVTFHWFISLYPLDFVSGMTPGVALLVMLAACIGLPLLQSLGFALLFYLLAWLSRTPFVRKRPLTLPLLFAAGWTFFAYTQSLTWAGVPWGANLALSQHQNLLLLLSASFFGSYFVTFIIAALNACLCMAVLYLRDKQNGAVRAMAFSALVLFFMNLGLSSLAYYAPREESGHITAAVLQGNLGSADKWSGEVDELALYRRLAYAAAEEGATLIVWPETALPYDIESNSYTIAALQQTASETGAIQIVGAFSQRTNENGERCRHNSLYLFYPDGRMDSTRYHKRHLVPFGEYVPLEGLVRTLLPFLADINMLQDSQTMLPGNDPALFYTEEGVIGGLICFDTIYPSLSRASVAEGAEILAIATNDSWFLDSAAVYQHNGQAVLRAVENGRSVLRSANTGISSIISPKGDILSYLDPLVEGYLVEEVPLSTQKTLYTQIGDSIVLLAFLAFHLPFVSTLLGMWQKKHEKKQEKEC